MASPVFYERIAASMPMQLCPEGCCEGHYDRLGVKVPAVRGGLCQACIDGWDSTPEVNDESESEEVRSALKAKYRKPRAKRPMRPINHRRTVAEIIRDKAAGVKVCTSCGKPKELFLFPKNSKSLDGRANSCSMCLNKNWMQKYYRRNG